MTFIESILSSVLGGIVLLLIASIFSENTRKLFISFISSLFGLDILFVYENKESVNKDLAKAIADANFVKILTARGNDFHNDVFSSLVKDRSNHAHIHILLPNAYKSSNVDWIDQRENELRKFDGTYGTGILKEQIKTNINALYSLNKAQLEIRLHQYPIIGRIVITDKYLFFTPMQENKYIRKVKTYKYSSSGNLYNHYLRLFNQLWTTAKFPPRK